MTPADRELAASIRRDLWLYEVSVCVSGLDGAGKSTLCAALAEALGVPVIQVPDRERVEMYTKNGRPAWLAQLASFYGQRKDAPPQRIFDRGPLCIAAIHPEAKPGALREAAHVDLTILLDLPLSEARARKADPEAELRDRDREAARYRELAARWPRTVILDASKPPEAVLSAALRAVARAVGVSA